MNDQAAAAGPFAKAARLLENLAGVHLTVKRVEREAERCPHGHVDRVVRARRRIAAWLTAMIGFLC
jgi:hypothetical protein